MKYQNKLHFLLLILAAIIFCGQELIHPVFHAHKQNGYCYSPGHTKTLKTKCSSEKHSNDFARSVFLKHVCPICGSVVNKSTAPTSIEAQLPECISSIYPQSCDSFLFNSYSNPISRGPPTV